MVVPRPLTAIIAHSQTQIHRAGAGIWEELDSTFFRLGRLDSSMILSVRSRLKLTQEFSEVRTDGIRLTKPWIKALYDDLYDGLCVAICAGAKQ